MTVIRNKITFEFTKEEKEILKAAYNVLRIMDNEFRGNLTEAERIDNADLGVKINNASWAVDDLLTIISDMEIDKE